MKKYLFLLPALVFFACTSSHRDNGNGPYGPHVPVSPSFVIQDDPGNQNLKLSTSFTGIVRPQSTHVFPVNDGINGHVLRKNKVQIAINAGDVWAYQPVTIGLYYGGLDAAGRPQGLIHQSIAYPPPVLGGKSSINDIAYLNGQTVRWITVDFPDFAGACVVLVQGFD